MQCTLPLKHGDKMVGKAGKLQPFIINNIINTYVSGVNVHRQWQGQTIHTL